MKLNITTQSVARLTARVTVWGFWLLVILVTTVWAATKIRSATIINSTVDSSPIGSTTPSTGVFTNLTWQSGPPTLQVSCVVNRAGDISFGANTQNQLDSCNVTMPSTGGPWRIFVAYSYYFSGGVNGECWTSDGSTVWNLIEWQPLSNIGSCGMAGFSKGTYANGAGPITISINEFDNGGTTVKQFSVFHITQQSYMHVAVVSSN